MYYSAIFSVNLVLTIMIVSAPAGVKNITAQLQQLLTVAMMSRITINLRKAGRLFNEGALPKSFMFDNKRKTGGLNILFPRSQVDDDSAVHESPMSPIVFKQPLEIHTETTRTVTFQEPTPLDAAILTPPPRGLGTSALDVMGRPREGIEMGRMSRESGW